MPRKKEQGQVAAFWCQRAKALLQERNNLTRDDLEYVVTKIDTMRDARLKACIGTLIGWGDDDRAELETFVAIAVELMKLAAPSAIKEAVRTVEIRSLMTRAMEQTNADDERAEETRLPDQDHRPEI